MIPTHARASRAPPLRAIFWGTGSRLRYGSFFVRHGTNVLRGGRFLGIGNPRMVRAAQDADEYFRDRTEVAQRQLCFIQLALLLRDLDRRTDDVPDRFFILG